MISLPTRVLSISILMLSVSAELSAVVYSGKVLERGLLQCFSEGLTCDSGKTALACPSAAIFHEGRLIIGGDKPVPGLERSAVMEFPFPLVKDSKPVYYNASIFQSTRKYEMATKTLDGKYGLLATGMSTAGKVMPEDVPYNRFLFFPLADPSNPQVVEEEDVLGISCSISVSRNVRQLLVSERFPDKVPYANIEGMTIIPGGKILFGLRQVGLDYDDFEYVWKIVQVSYQIQDGKLYLGKDYELIYSFDVTTVPGIRHDIGISSLEYDPYGDRLYVLSSYEGGSDSILDEDLGAYLWVLPMADFHSKRPPQLVRKPDGRVFTLAHKMEGMDVLGPNKIIVVADDDYTLGREVIVNPETQFSRRHNEAAYAIVEVNNSFSYAQYNGL